MVHGRWLMVIMIEIIITINLKIVLWFQRYKRFLLKMHMTETTSMENNIFFFLIVKSPICNPPIPFTSHIWRNVFLIKQFKLNSVILFVRPPQRFTENCIRQISNITTQTHTCMTMDQTPRSHSIRKRIKFIFMRIELSDVCFMFPIAMLGFTINGSRLSILDSFKGNHSFLMSLLKI